MTEDGFGRSPSRADTICQACTEPANRGLCHTCATRDRSILPQLKEPSLRALIANSRPATKPAPVPDLPSLNTPGRKLARLQIAMAGGRVRNRSLALA